MKIVRIIKTIFIVIGKGSNMVARQMYKKIGFECIKENHKKIIYEKKHYKKIIINKKTGHIDVISNYVIINRNVNMTNEELLATHKLLKELDLEV